MAKERKYIVSVFGHKIYVPKNAMPAPAPRADYNPAVTPVTEAKKPAKRTKAKK